MEKIIPKFLLVIFLTYLILELNHVIEHKEPHLTEQTYPTNIAYITPIIASGTSIVAGPTNFIRMGSTET